MQIHLATQPDMRLLAVHHRKMFEEIWLLNGQLLDAVKAEAIEKAYLEKIEKQIPEGTCLAWLVQDGEQTVASGAITIASLVPVPNDTNHTVAYLHSMYTEKDYRGRKLARQIITQAVTYCRTRGIRRIILNASDAGRPLYEKLGFVASPEAMRMFIN